MDQDRTRPGAPETERRTVVMWVGVAGLALAGGVIAAAAVVVVLGRGLHPGGPVAGYWIAAVLMFGIGTNPGIVLGVPTSFRAAIQPRSRVFGHVSRRTRRLTLAIVLVGVAVAVAGVGPLRPVPTHDPTALCPYFLQHKASFRCVSEEQYTRDSARTAAGLLAIASCFLAVGSRALIGRRTLHLKD